MNILDYRCYISKEGEVAVKNFQYKGSCQSILYAYLWSPLCNYIVDNIIPQWVAPNVITLFAMIQLVFVHALFISYSPLAESELPQWLYFLGGFSVLTYQVLDNCDGKQARKTNNSSPLGMLFDHGCDSMTSWIIGMTLLVALQAGYTTLSFFAILFITKISFFIAQWSQYHVGHFKLGKINGVDQGLVGVQLLLILPGLFGPGVYSWIVPLVGLKLSQTILYVLTLVAIFQCGEFMHDTYKGGQHSFSTALFDLLCAALLFFTYFVIANYSPNNQLSSDMYIIVLGLGLLWSNVTGYVQIAHITEQKFTQFSLPFVVANLLITLNILLAQFTGSSPLFEERSMSILVLIIGILTHGHMIFCICNHFSEILGIRIFLINKKQQEKYDELPQIVEMK